MPRILSIFTQQEKKRFESFHQDFHQVKTCTFSPFPRHLTHSASNNGHTYIVINALARRLATFHDVIVVAMVDEQQAARLNASLKVHERLLLVALIADRVQHVGKRVAHTNDGVEAVANQMFDVVVQRQPIGLFDYCVFQCESIGVGFGQETSKFPESSQEMEGKKERKRKQRRKNPITIRFRVINGRQSRPTSTDGTAAKSKREIGDGRSGHTKRKCQQ